MIKKRANRWWSWPDGGNTPTRREAGPTAAPAIHSKLGGPAGRQGALVDRQLGQALARHVLHHQVMLVGIGAAVDPGHDGLAQPGPGQGPGLPPEPSTNDGSWARAG